MRDERRATKEMGREYVLLVCLFRSRTQMKQTHPINPNNLLNYIPAPRRLHVVAFLRGFHKSILSLSPNPELTPNPANLVIRCCLSMTLSRSGIGPLG